MKELVKQLVLNQTNTVEIESCRHDVAEDGDHSIEALICVRANVARAAVAVGRVS